MKGWLSVAVLITAACLAGIAAGQWMLASAVCRDAIGVLFGRGHLLALAHGRGIYRVDLERALAEGNDAGGERQDRHAEGVAAGILDSLIANTMVQVLGAQEKISPVEIDRELELLREQFRDEKEWKASVRKSGLSTASLRRMLKDDLRADRWIRQRLDPQLKVSIEECRTFYEAHRPSFSQPERFRASHLFLAAPPETPPEIVDQKRDKIEPLSKRLADGEDFFELVALESEDDETKARGGDLGFFAEPRMAADFFAAVRKMPLGRISSPVRTRLGFHIVRLTDSKPARQMSFDEVKAEIALRIENEKRRTAVRNLAAAMLARGDLVRFPR